MLTSLTTFVVRAESPVMGIKADPILLAELSDDEKRHLFLKAREDIHIHASPTPVPKPKSKPRPAPKEEETPQPTPRPKPVEHHQEVKHPVREVHATPTPAPPEPKHEEKPSAPTPTPAPVKQETQQTEAPAAPVTIEKSGMAQEEGYVAPAAPAFSFFKFGGPKYRYLTPSIRKQVDAARVRRGRWKYIIVHNSGTRQGNARAFDIYHRNVRKMQNGMAYHFVIGDGHGSGDGEIEIGNRWKKQINGGHVASDYLNNIAIGICLVGDFNRDQPTKAQMAALEELINYLRKRVGKFDNNKPSTVLGHKEINPRPTDCPGDHFPLRRLHELFKN
ncbi:MAG: N-acetylmuramoyl-L-alanine amidase [Chthoniobacterales bacterium]